MKDGHDKSNRRDKGKQPHYWEHWIEAGFRPVSEPRAAAIFDHVCNVRRPLLVEDWPIAHLLDSKLVQHCSSHAGRFKKAAFIKTTLSCSSTRTVYREQRQIGKEIDEVMLLIDDSAKALKRLAPHCIGIGYATSEGGMDPIAQLAEASEHPKRYLGRLFNIRNLLATGHFPIDFTNSPLAAQAETQHRLRFITHYLYLRRAVDLFYQRPYAKRHGFSH